MDDDEGMGQQTLSLEGFFHLHPAISDADRAAAAEAARLELEATLEEDRQYWTRLSSAVLSEEVAPADVGHVAEEFRDFAVSWRRYGRGLDVISDFKAHIQTRQDRFERKQASKMSREDQRRRRDEAMAARAPAAASTGRGGGGGSRGGGGGGRGGGAPPADMYDDVAAVMPYDPSFVLTILDAIDETLAKIHDGICVVVPEVQPEERVMMDQGYKHMMETFKLARLKRKYGYTASDHRQPELTFGGDVPSYFANVTDQSIYRRKVLTMAGLRNLVMFGPTIYTQLKAVAFTGDLEKHPSGTGLHLMRSKTGNVVDLDTTVLRCSDGATLNVINASNAHKKERTYASVAEFAASQQAQDIAIHCAIPLLADFAKVLGLKRPEELRARCIDPEQIGRPKVYVAGSNTDRGKHPVWQYVNAGQNSFHVNVPTMEDVNGALLKAPFHCLRHWLTLHVLFDGEELDKWIDTFFEDCVVDACFNMKWKAVEEFSYKIQHEGTIVDVLQKAQAANQAVFTMAFFDADTDDHANEKAAMWRIVTGKSGREQKTGRIRGITSADVDAWVDDPSIEI